MNKVVVKYTVNKVLVNTSIPYAIYLFAPKNSLRELIINYIIIKNDN